MRGAESSYAFMNPLPFVEDKGPEDHEMLGQRLGVRTCIFTGENRVDGPAAASRPEGASAPGPIIEMGTFNSLTPEDEFEMGVWYAQVRLPALAHMPGCVGARKLVSSAGWAKHGILYEFVSADALENFRSSLPGISKGGGPAVEWSVRVVRRLLHAPGSPTMAARLWPPA